MMKKHHTILVILLLSATLMGQDQFGRTSSLSGQSISLPSTQQLQFQTIVSHKSAQPDEMLHIAIKVIIPTGEHLYSPFPGGKIVKPIALKVYIGKSVLKPSAPLFTRPIKKTTRYPNGLVDTHYVYDLSLIHI